MSLSRLVLRNSVWLAAAQVVGRAAGFALTAVLAHLLTPSDFGLAGLATIIVGIIAVFGDVGLVSALVQRIEISDAHLSTAFWFNTGVATLVAVVGIAISATTAFINGKPSIAVLIAVLMFVLPLRSLGQVPDALLQRRVQFNRVAVAELASGLMAGLIAVIFALSGAGVWALIWQAITLATVSSGTRFLLARWLPRLQFSWDSAHELFSFSGPLLGLYLLNFIARNADNFLVGVFLGLRALGYYTLAYNLILMPSLYVGSLIQRVLTPILSSMQNDLERFRSVYLRMARLVATANLPLVAGLFAVAPIFVVAVYGAKWAPSISLVRILCVVGAFEGVSTSSVVFFATGRLKLQLVWATLTVALQTLAFVLAVRHGLAAVAWSYVAVSPLVFLVPHLLANRLILLPNKSLLQAILPGLLASLLMGGIVAFAAASQPWFREKSLAELSALTCMGAVLYGVLLVAAGAILSGTVKGGVTWVLGKQLTASGSVSMSPRQ